MKAHNDDSEAFEQLARWGYNKEFESYPYRDIASNTYESIRHTYLEKITPVFAIIPWPEGVDQTKLSYTNFKEAFKQLPQKFHAHLVNLIWASTNLSEEKKRELFVDVITVETKTSNSLNAKYVAGTLLARQLKIPWQPFDYRPIIEALKKSQGTTTTKVE